MPRFYFDVTDSGRTSHDEVGFELPDIEAARSEALATLGSIVKDELPDGDHREFVIGIRDGSPKPVLTASLSLWGREAALAGSPVEEPGFRRVQS